MAIYSNNPKIGVKAIINTTDNNWNRNEELRALASFITQIRIDNRNKKITIAVQNRKELCRIVFKNHSEEVKELQIISEISQLHSNIFIAV